MSDEADRYDLKALVRFVDTVLLNQPSDDLDWLLFAKREKNRLGIPEQPESQDMIAAAFALIDALQGINLRRKFKGRCPTQKQMRMKTDHPAFFTVVMALNGKLETLDGETQRQAAIRMLAEEILQITPKKAETYYDKARPSAQTTLERINRMYKMNGWGDFNLCPTKAEATSEEQAQAVFYDKNLKYTEKVKRIQDILGVSYPEAQQVILNLHAKHK
ncbi:MAG: hypothetical protein PHO08_13415 [Methylococcales bacterium]|nr:hypothetical protein [Methylococcales bacterium]